MPVLKNGLMLREEAFARFVSSNLTSATDLPPVELIVLE